MWPRGCRGAGAWSRRRGHIGNRRVPGAVRHPAPADVVVGPTRGEPDVVRPLPLAAGFGPPVAGEDDESDVHGLERSVPATVAPWPTSRRPGGGIIPGGWRRGPRESASPTPSRPTLLKAADARSGQRIFDVGCGGGALTITLADVVAPDGEVVGLDISSALLELARQRAAEQVVRMSASSTWTCRPARSSRAVRPGGQPIRGHVLRRATAALAAIKSRLVPDGRFVFACWQSVERNPWHVGRALRPLLPPPATPPPGKSPVGPLRLRRRGIRARAARSRWFRDCPHRSARGHRASPAEAVSHPSLFGLMGVPPDREEEAAARLEAHLLASQLGRASSSTRSPSWSTRRWRRRRRLVMAGYSGTPLAKKLAITEASSLALGCAGGVDRGPAAWCPGETPGTAVRPMLWSAFFTASVVLERRIERSGTWCSLPAACGWPGPSAPGGGDDDQRGHRPRGGPAARPGGQQGVRHRRNLVRSAAGLATRAPRPVAGPTVNREAAPSQKSHPIEVNRLHVN